MTHEDVIKGLECLAKRHGIVGVCEPESCPYGDLHTCENEIARDVLTLLKAQEPCDFCKYSSKDDWFYLSADWDDGIGFEGHRMAYCPKCGRKLPDEK